jgi:hypothetical protein
MADMRRGVRVRLPLAGVSLAAVATPLSTWLAGTPQGSTWARLLDDTMSDRPGVWRLMRGGLAFLAIPALLVVLAALLLYLYRRRTLRSLAVLAAVALLGNVTAQFVKHVPFGLGEAWSTLNPLSGHVAVTASIGLGWLVVVPARRRSVSTIVVLATTAGVSAGVIAAGWHTPFQVLCPLLISTGWATALAPFADEDLEPGAGGVMERPWLDWVLVLVGVGTVAAVVLAVQHGFVDGSARVPAVLIALAGAAGGASASVGLATRAARIVRRERRGVRERRSDVSRLPGKRSRGDAVLGH